MMVATFLIVHECSVFVDTVHDVPCVSYYSIPRMGVPVLVHRPLVYVFILVWEVLHFIG